MLDFAIFAVTFVLALLGLVIYLYPSRSKPTTVPGLEPIDPKEGNLADIAQAGSLHEFLCELHEKYGSIASFWMGEQLVVSISSAEMFKQQLGFFDRPPSLFKLVEPIIGAQSIQYANKADGRLRRNIYDKCYSHSSIKYLYPVFYKFSVELANKWSTMMEDQHIPVTEYMYAFAIKSIALGSFGDHFKDDKKVIELRKSYDELFREVEKQLNGDVPKEGTPEAKRFHDAIKCMDDIVDRLIKDRRACSPVGKTDDEYLLIDAILELEASDELTHCDVITFLIGGFHTTSNAKKHMDEVVDSLIKDRRARPPPGHEYLLIDSILELDASDEQTRDDVISYLIGGFHTTGNALSWAIYFLASHPEVQEKAAEEIWDVIGDDEVDGENSAGLVYLRQIIDETLRCAVLAPWGARYVPDADTELGGHVIPAGTPVLHAFGVSLQDEKVWPDPNKFDPDRFSPENVKGRPSLAFAPFGFAGKRKCPGYRFAYAEITTMLSVILRRFKIKMVEDQVVIPRYSFVTAPADEVWITVEERKRS